jgi:hypothetical protein
MRIKKMLFWYTFVASASNKLKGVLGLVVGAFGNRDVALPSISVPQKPNSGHNSYSY